MRESNQSDVRVWDLLVRVSHWLLVAAFFIAYITENDPLTVHVWAGYIVGGVWILRFSGGLSALNTSVFLTSSTVPARCCAICET